jgi:hypothetical protein
MARVKRMLAVVLVVGAIYVSAPLSEALGQNSQVTGQSVHASRFVGEWVGFQTWAIEDPPPNVGEPQPVEVKIQVVEGKLVGVIAPFMGGFDGASFVGGQIIREELKGSGGMGPPPLPAVKADPQATRRIPRWKTSVRVNFSFVAGENINELRGTADVLMGQVTWIKYKYDLKKKRSRY